MTTYIALLRGINVGGNHMVKMAELKAMLAELGYAEAKTLLQSGNVVFRGEERKREELEKLLEDATDKRFGFRPAYLVRTLGEWEKMLSGNPFTDQEKKDPSHLLVAFTKTPPDKHEVKAVQDAIQGPERIQAGSEHLYLIYPDGIGTSKVDRTPGWKKLHKDATARNWNTLQKLAMMARELG
ncbi:DUF1697 domain-containing protein [soil metagenome]